MEELKIELRNGYETCKEFYFRNGNGDVFTYKVTKKLFILSTFSIIVTALFYFLSLVYPETSWIFLLVLCSIITVTVLAITIFKCAKYFSWKRETVKYLNSLKKFDCQQLLVTINAIELSNSDQTSIEKWKTITHSQIDSDFIYLKGEFYPYLFPRRSMEIEQFNQLKEFVKQRMNDPSFPEE